ncbi:probable 4-coumarate--CoA ligase 5 [Mizuhopecten yessoensis]|uniref:Luciferin 4-monooxygenase n=1 Tax=Mizuhopecten yessoensis TaxID=6573 RepID=A0A210PLH6_MIZYE|nr:probable 4-coumarate--CoA ligase 5 [Mizuhopecten yessoensis]OWF37342.1 4-coumarate--CoA ligase 3 [Mizuhopecten yessoensis]
MSLNSKLIRYCQKFRNTQGILERHCKSGNICFGAQQDIIQNGRCITTLTTKEQRLLKRETTSICAPVNWYYGAPRSQDVFSQKDGNNIVRSPYEDLDIPKVTFTEYVFSQLDDHKSPVCLVDSSTGRKQSASELKDITVRVASGLTRMGYKKGDKIIIFARNCMEYPVMFLACGATGIVLSTANPVYTPSELGRQLKHSGCVAIVTLPSMLETVRKALASDPEVKQNIKHVISIGGGEGCVPFSNLAEDDGKAFPENVVIDPMTDVLTLPYSSGTTGLPKGVELTHNNLVANLVQCIRGPMKLDPNTECLMGFLPFYHIYGMVPVQLGAICLGTKLVVMPKFEPEVFLRAIEEHKISYMHIVPPTILFLAKSPLVEKFDVSSLKTLVCAAAPLGVGLTGETKTRLNVDITQAYGLTECSPLTHYDTYPGKEGTIGQLVTNTDGKVVDIETGQALLQGQTGEIMIRGPQVMKGYLNNQKATDEMVVDGWLHTGDIGHYDKEGYFIVSDRMKELIKYKGYQVAPAELEALICTHPMVEDVAVIGVTSEAGEGHGEVPRAFVVPKTDCQLTEEDVSKFVQEHLSPYKWLRGGVELTDSIPKTASGKILRRQLKK